MTPELRAARDRLARFAGPEAQPLTLDLPSDFTYLTITEAERLVNETVQGVRETLTPDVRIVLAALDQLYGDDAAPVITDSLTYVTANEDAKNTALRDEIERLAGERNDAVRERDLWEARTRKLLGERSGRLVSDAAPSKPHGHPWHACGSCSPDGMHPGKGCINCRHTGFDQTPCLKCDDDPASRVILKPIDDTERKAS